MSDAAEQFRRQRLLGRMALSSALLVFIVVLASAYLRLSNAGLGCADWPLCYGSMKTEGAAASTESAVPGQTIVRLTHRLAAMLVSIFNLLIAYLAWMRQPARIGNRVLAVALIALTVFLSLIGRATTGTHLPAITMGNLLGGLTLLALTWWAWLTAGNPPSAAHRNRAALSMLGGLTLTLVTLQLVLGAWLSSRYAGPSCITFPDCNGAWWPRPWRWSDLNPFFALQYREDGPVLATTAMQALNMAHRLVAILVAASVSALSAALLRDPSSRRLGATLLLTVFLAMALGIAAVLLGFPLWLILAHDGSAALLLLATLSAYRRFCAT